MFKKTFHTIVDWFKNLGKAKKEKQIISETPPTTVKKHTDYFAAVAVRSNRVCISGYKDKFMAIKEDGKWRKGYPEFDDLMDNFSEVEDFAEIDKYSSEARIALNIFLN